MLVKLGPTDNPTDVVGLLTACHDRIRFFIDLAKRLADADDVAQDEIQQAATRVVRYFEEALPLHVADEEQSVVPRLAGRDQTLDSTLESMRREHRAHEPLLLELGKLCRMLQVSPERLAEIRRPLHQTASSLQHDFAEHLREEEKVVLPAINSLLSDEERTAILSELRARRM